MSTWYRTGTVSVTNGSKNVVGTGTAWSVMISVGDVFTLDNSVLYEIQTITDDLHIVLDRNYQGSTATDQTYTIIPWSVKRSLNSEILDRINKLLEWAHEVFVTQWTTDTNGDYEVSTTLDKNIVPKVNNGASLGTTLKKWAKAYLTALSINGVDILPTTTPTALGIPIADENGNIADGWISAALLGLNGATVFKGTLGTNGTVTALPTADYVRGWTYKVITAGTYAGVAYEIGDLIIALTSFDTEFKNSDWIPVHIADEMNLKADVTYVDAELALKADASDVADALALKADADDVINALASAVDENIPIFDGIAGDKLKDSGVKLSDKADLTYVEYLMMEGDPA